MDFWMRERRAANGLVEDLAGVPMVPPAPIPSTSQLIIVPLLPTLSHWLSEILLLLFRPTVQYSHEHRDTLIVDEIDESDEK